MNTFLSNQNIKTLWDVIIDEDIIKNKPRDFIQIISQMFINNMENFYHNEKTLCKNLLEMNQKYIMVVLNYAFQIEQKMKNSSQPPPPQKLTHEEIQNQRRSKFDEELERKQKEFESSIQVKVPEKPNFSDNFEDTPINNMDQILKEISEKRNYDVYINPQNSSQNPSWLSPMETSIRKEKFTQNTNDPQTKSQLQSKNQNNIKYIKINEELDNTIIEPNIIDLGNDSPKKTVSWGDNQVHNVNLEIYENIDDNNVDNYNFNNNYQNNDEDNDKMNLFKKLKKITPTIEEPKIETINNVNNIDNLQNQINGLHQKIETIQNDISNILTLLQKQTIT